MKDIESLSQMDCGTSSLEHPTYDFSQTSGNQFSFTRLLMVRSLILTKKYIFKKLFVMILCPLLLKCRGHLMTDEGGQCGVQISCENHENRIFFDVGMTLFSIIYTTCTYLDTIVDMILNFYIYIITVSSTFGVNL